MFESNLLKSLVFENTLFYKENFKNRNESTDRWRSTLPIWVLHAFYEASNQIFWVRFGLVDEYCNSVWYFSILVTIYRKNRLLIQYICNGYPYFIGCRIPSNKSHDLFWQSHNVYDFTRWLIWNHTVKFMSYLSRRIDALLMSNPKSYILLVK